MGYKTIIAILFLVAFLMMGCTQETAENTDNSTNNTPEEPLKSHSVTLDEPLIIDVEKETVTIELGTGKIIKTLHNESNRTVEMFNDSDNESLNETE